MSFQIGTATDYSDLLSQLDTFLTSQGMTLEPAFAGTGNGTIANLVGGSASVAETITITFTDATHFDVAGTVTGAIASGTTGSAFTSTKIKFTITAGGTAFVAGDVFTVATTPKWISKRRTAGDQMIWQAPGNGGLDAILVGAKLFSSVTADYYNWRLGGFLAFDAGLAFENQAGYVGGVAQAQPSPVLNLWDSSIPYWFIANGRRVIVIAKISTVYVAAYLGFLAPYASPGSFPYPLVVGGSMAWDGLSAAAIEPSATDARWRWSYTGTEIHSFPMSHGGSASGNPQGAQLRMRLTGGNWQGFIAANDPQWGRIWPIEDSHAGGMLDWRADLDGGYSILPVVLRDPQIPNTYGELEGVGAITGFQQSAENTITAGADQWLVVPDVFRGSKVDYFAVKLA